jgi:hypothetical protein
MAHRAQLRASDADRELVAERLRQATAEGRLTPNELEHRLGAALSAQTYGELDALVADLPSGAVTRGGRSSILPWIPPVVALALAIPLALIVLALVLFVVTGLFVGWLFWIFLGWWFFSGRRRPLASRGRQYPGGWGCYRRCGPPRTQSRSGFRL